MSGKNPSKDTLSRSTSDVDALEQEIVARIAALKHRDTKSFRAVRRDYTKRLAKISPTLVINLAVRLTRSQSVPRFIAYELLLYHRAALQSIKASALNDLGDGMHEWWDVDSFACYLAGPVWRERQVPDSLIQNWARSKDRWWRRAALACTIPLNNKTRGGLGDAHRTLLICKMLVDDRDDMVVKAMSWALRELSKRNPLPVQQFLRAHEGRLAPRIVREVNNKLNTGLKNPGGR